MKWKALVIAAALASYGSGVSAQTPAGEIKGLVVDQTGAALPDVSLTIVNTETTATRELRTDRDGRFTAPGLRVGSYEVTAARAGFATRRQEALPVQVGRTSWVRLELTLAAEPETITVADVAPVIEPARSHIAGFIDAPSIENLPANGRQFLDLTLSLPGVTRDVETGQVLIAGNDATMNRVLVDGADSITFWPPLGVSGAFAPYPVSPDAVQEFRVDLNGYRAEYGSAGSVIHVVTKSGTNQFRGVASAFHGETGSDAQRSRRSNQFAGTIGGPIARDRHFFLVNADGLQTREPVTRDQELFLVATDHQLTNAHRVMLRYNDQQSNPSTRSFASTLTSVLGANVVNDLRMYNGRGRFAAAGPAFRVDRLQAADTLTLIAGAHEVKTGVDARVDDTFVRDDVHAVSTFVQDEWQATSGITLNFGVRHDHQFDSQWNPRLGATWLRPGGRMLVRGSYGWFSGLAPWTVAAMAPGLALTDLTDPRVRQASGGVEWEWMPQTTAALTYLHSDGDLRHYRAITTEVHRRLWHGMQGRFAYTLGTLTNDDGTRAREDHRHRVVQSLIYPTNGLAERFGGIVRKVLADWTISGVLTAQSGRAAVPAYISIDPRLARNIDLGGSRQLSLMWEAFNFRERPNYLSVASPLAIDESTIEPKVTQFAARFSF